MILCLLDVKTMRKVADEINKCNLGQQNQRKAIFELLVHCLMMPDFHAKQCTNAAANDCKYQQGCLRYAPAALLGPPLDLRSSLLTLGIPQTSLALPSLTRSLVNAIDEEGHDVNNYQII